MNKYEKIISLLKDKKILKFGLNLKFDGYLKEIGWIKSFENFLPQNVEGSPLPWVTYSYISFIEKRIKREMNIFEYGTGNSTQYYACRVKKIYSVEHDKKWYENLKNSVPENAFIFYENLEKNGKYSKKIQEMPIKFDLIVVDGRDRVNCIKNSYEYLAEGGVVVLDDSERVEYEEGRQFLLKKGFREIEFWGIAPGIFYNKCTSIFYKSQNILNI